MCQNQRYEVKVLIMLCFTLALISNKIQTIVAYICYICMYCLKYL